MSALANMAMGMKKVCLFISYPDDVYFGALMHKKTKAHSIQRQ